MPWVRPTLPQLIERTEGDISSRLTNNAPLLRRSLLKILARVWGGLTHILHGYQTYLSKQFFISTAESPYLKIIAHDRGVTPIAATFASGEITITGTSTTAIPLGLVFVSEAGLEYETTENETIGGGGTVNVAVRCRQAGEDGNLVVASTLSIQAPLDGIDDSAVVVIEIAGGVNAETDESIRARILQQAQNPPAGGALSDYIRWAKSIAGVGGVWPFANYYGNGTVAVVIKATGDDPEPAPALVGAVQDFIDQPDIRPVTATVTVLGVNSVVIDFTMHITPDTAALRTAIEDALTALLATQVEPGGDFFLSQIQEAIMRVGVRDYSITAIKKDTVPVFALTGPSETYTFPDFEYPIFGAVTWT